MIKYDICLSLILRIGMTMIRSKLKRGNMEKSVVGGVWRGDLGNADLKCL